MNPMSIRDDLSNSPRESFSTTEPLSVVGVCLDEETWTVLKLFAESAPLIKLRSHLSDYRVQENDSPAEWLGTPAPEICIVDFDRDRRVWSYLGATPNVPASRNHFDFSCPESIFDTCGSAQVPLTLYS